jgi:hypothetical protein
MTTKEILKANNWPDSYANSVEGVLYQLERHEGTSKNSTGAW